VPRERTQKLDRGSSVVLERVDERLAVELERP